MLIHTLSTLDAGNLPLFVTSSRLFRDPGLIPHNRLSPTPMLFSPSIDCALGYGLTYEDALQNTHLGRIGR